MKSVVESGEFMKITKQKNVGEALRVFPTTAYIYTYLPHRTDWVSEPLSFPNHSKETGLISF